MADAQIVSSAVTAAPSVYELTGSAEFTLKAVNAHFDGSGAAGSWLPCVEIVSDSNHIIARACDQAVMVTAGDDAEVSWFPGVKHAGGGSATTDFPFLILTGQTKNVPNPPSGDSDHAKFKAIPVWTNALSEWAFTLDAGGFIKQINVNGPGLYHLACAFEWDVNATAYRKDVAINASGNVVQTYNDPNFFGVSPYWEVTSLTWEADVIEALCPINASGGYFTVEPSTNVAAGKNFRANYLFITKYPLSP